MDGTLREADWEERDRMCQLFFPKLGRKMWLPKMFHPQQLPKVLSLGHHLNVLDRVCVQCAPDSKEYIRVSLLAQYLLRLVDMLLHDRFTARCMMILNREVYTRSSGQRGTLGVWFGISSQWETSVVCSST